MSTERELFERFFFVGLAPDQIKRIGEIYYLLSANTAWNVWRAARKQPATPEPGTIAEYTLTGLIEFVRRAAHQNSGAVPWHMRNLLAQCLPYLQAAATPAQPAPAVPKTFEFGAVSKGETDEPGYTSTSDAWTAGISVGTHVNAIECHAATQEKAEALRNNVLAALATPAQQGEPVAPVVPAREALADLIAQSLHGTYHCTRVWNAWNFGTMSQDDFEPVDESDTPGEIADAVLTILAAAPQPEPLPKVQQVRQPLTKAEFAAAMQRHLPGWEPDESLGIWESVIKAAVEAAHGITGEQPEPVVPATHKLVPIEPTEAMLNALRANTFHARDAWAAMLAAAPQPELPLDCWCERCDLAANPYRSRMSLCPGCGDKRCPRSLDHINKCQGEQP